MSIIHNIFGWLKAPYENVYTWCTHSPGSSCGKTLKRYSFPSSGHWSTKSFVAYLMPQGKFTSAQGSSQVSYCLQLCSFEKPFVLCTIIFVSYCCITHPQKSSVLKQHAFVLLSHLQEPGSQYGHCSETCLTTVPLWRSGSFHLWLLAGFHFWNCGTEVTSFVAYCQSATTLS